jgi:predicted DNA-binding transcriptional regulator YafY
MISLYCNRSFNKTEMESLEEKFIKLFPPKEERNLRKLFSSLKYNYKPVHHGETKEKIHLLSHAIINQNKLTFLYKQKSRIVEPYSILYHDRMYYLIASEEGEDMKRIWRFDRIHNLKILEEHFTRDKHEVFSSGDFANLTFNMFNGKPITVTLNVENSTVEYVQRAFPEAKIIENHVSSFHTRMEVKVAGEEGILKWLLSQQDDIEVLSPLSLREKVQETIKNMASLYKLKIHE